MLSTFSVASVLAVPPLPNSIVIAYPGWRIRSDVYLVTYHRNKSVRKVYKHNENPKKNNILVYFFIVDDFYCYF